MLKETRNYTDFNGENKTEDFYFNLTKAEIAEMELAVDGGFQSYLKRIINAKDTPSLVAVFKKIILKAYGIKSDDGKYFRKSDEISYDFSQTQVYSDMFIELSTDAQKASDFINGIIPPDLRGDGAK